jgi:hypothetical protein
MAGPRRCVEERVMANERRAKRLTARLERRFAEFTSGSADPSVDELDELVDLSRRLEGVADR